MSASDDQTRVAAYRPYPARGKPRAPRDLAEQVLDGTLPYEEAWRELAEAVIRLTDQAASPREVRYADVIGAIRLALVGAGDAERAVAVIWRLCDAAPDTPPRTTGPTVLLVDAITAITGSVRPRQARQAVRGSASRGAESRRGRRG